MIKISYLLGLIIIVVCKEKKMNYDTSNPYAAISQFFGKPGYEVPDGCPDHTQHIKVQKDSKLNRNVFTHTLHKSSSIVDNDRCINHDRQRNQVSVTGSSQSWMKGYDDLKFSYAWKLFLPSDFVVSGAFCHLHQIKYDGGGVGTPNVTLTARSHVQLQNFDKKTVLASVNLKDFVGDWVQIREVVTYGSSGHIQFKATRIKDGATLMNYSGSISLPAHGNLIRPKFGFYRSLENSDSLKTETVKLVDLCIGQNDSCHYNQFGQEVNNHQPYLTKEI